MEASVEACSCMGWGHGPPASAASATVLVGSERRLLGYILGTQLSPSHSLAHFQSWMAHLEMTLHLG